MSPRIAPNQIIAIAKGPTECWGVLERNDIVLFHSDSMKIPLIKALRALPGDTFSTENGRLIVNGKAVTNSQGVAYQLSVPRATMIGLYAQEFHGVIPPEKFLVMGENPAGTTDSSRFGLIERAQILGKVVER